MATQIESHFKRHEYDAINKLFSSYFKARGCTDLYHHPEQYNSYDAQFFSGNSHVLIEHKIRSKSTTAYLSAFIEIDKFNELKTFFSASGCTVLFAQEFRDFTIIWNITDQFVLNRLRSGHEYCPARTCIDKGYVLKPVYYLPFTHDDAVILKTINMKPVSHKLFLHEYTSYRAFLDEAIEAILES